MKKLLCVTIIFLAAFLIGGNAFAFGTNITIFDENRDSGEGVGPGYEDEEVEPGMTQAQAWDLEGFFLDGYTLSMIGGYDFVDGEYESKDGTNYLWNSGDIFIDIDGDAIFGDIHGKTDGNYSVFGTYGYDYVLDLDFYALTYDVYVIYEDAAVTTTYYKENQGSNPWRYESGGILLEEGGIISYTSGLADSEVGFDGSSHNAVTVDLSFLKTDITSDFTAHFTMEGGNDNLMGRGSLGGVPSPVPEPSTVILLGLGLIGLTVFRKKFVKG